MWCQQALEENTFALSLDEGKVADKTIAGITSTGISYLWWYCPSGQLGQTAGNAASSLLVECCLTSTETVGLLGTGAQDGHLDFHTVSEL